VAQGIARALGWKVSAQRPTSATLGVVIVTAAGFRVGDDVAVWSASSGAWIEDGEITDASIEDGLTVLYNEGESSKDIPFAQAIKLLKRRENDDPIVGTEFSIGEEISVWSESNQKWIDDGQLTEASVEDGITVTYNNGESSKTFDFAQAGKYIKKLGKRAASASEVASSQQSDDPNREEAAAI